MYLPSSPLYALIPESTLTPAPDKTVTFPTERKVDIRSIASATETGGLAIGDESKEEGIVGTLMRICPAHARRSTKT